MYKKTKAIRTGLIASLVVLGVGLTACSSDDDGDDTDDTSSETDTGDGDTTGDGDADNTGDGDDSSTLNPNLVTLSLLLDSTSTVPPANVDGASGEGSVSVDTSTGAISGSVTVSGTTGVPTAAHVHQGAAGEAGPVVVGMEGNEDGTVWTIAEGEALDAAGIEAFNNGNLYINVHTEANEPGELRAQLVDTSAPAAGSYTITFTNTSDAQPMTPPMVALHNAPGSENGIRLFEVGTPASAEVIDIAENGAFQGLLDVATGQIPAGTVSAAGAAFTDPENPGPLLPGASASITLMPEMPNQVISIVSMVVCTNDGFTGVDSRPLMAETFTAPIYDAGSETNVTTLDYWVPPCGDPDSPNLTDDEGGLIAMHPGQTVDSNPEFDFAAGTQLLEVTITQN